jgi:hypothetical protein
MQIWKAEKRPDGRGRKREERKNGRVKKEERDTGAGCAATHKNKERRAGKTQ